MKTMLGDGVGKGELALRKETTAQISSLLLRRLFGQLLHLQEGGSYFQLLNKTEEVLDMNYREQMKICTIMACVPNS